jgi:hypothetical protein
MEGEKDQGLFPAFDVMKDPPILFPFMINNPVDQLQGQSSYGDQRLRHQVLAESTHQQVRGSQFLYGCMCSIKGKLDISLSILDALLVLQLHGMFN